MHALCMPNCSATLCNYTRARAKEVKSGRLEGRCEGRSPRRPDSRLEAPALPNPLAD